MAHFLKNKKIIVAPLNWGLGHATRCVPIIDYLLEKEASVILASDGNTLNFLRETYPSLTYHELPSYNVLYGKINFITQTALNFPAYFKAVLKEKKYLKELAKKEKIDLVISDNRYGFYHSQIPSVIICHQVCMLAPPSAPWLRNPLYTLHKSFLKPFSQIWVPDFESDSYNLSGDMSHHIELPKNVKYIGALTRMKRYAIENSNPEVDIVVMLSGVEPQRTYLEETIIQQAEKITDRNFIILRGIVKDENLKNSSNIKILTYAKGKELNDLLLKAEIVICRSGYSSVMDLYYLGKKVIFIPSKGQTEQEYLAEIATNNEWAIKENEDNLNLNLAIKKVSKTKGLPTYDIDLNLLEKVFKELNF